MPIYMPHMNSLTLMMSPGPLYPDANDDTETSNDAGSQHHSPITLTESATWPNQSKCRY